MYILCASTIKKMALPVSYLVGAGLLATSRFAPIVLDLGLWGASKVVQGLYWVAWGRRGAQEEAAEQEDRIRRIIREEILNNNKSTADASEAEKNTPDDSLGENG